MMQDKKRPWYYIDCSPASGEDEALLRAAIVLYLGWYFYLAGLWL